MPFPAIDLKKVKTYPLINRSSLVALNNFIFPDQAPPIFYNSDLQKIAELIVKARRSGRPVIWNFGGHVVKCGLAPVIIELLKKGVITHLSSNGSASIHDFEIAYTGNTSEDVAASLEDGSFGMAEETGNLMNLAIQSGVQDGLGMGEALGRFLAQNDKFQYKQYSLLYQAYRLNIPFTIHVAIGTDIIHQHPQCDFAAIGWASGQDFKIFVHSVTQLEGGVFCNFGSSVIGPEVFLKSVSIARNLGAQLNKITTANFDLVPLKGDYRQPSDKQDPEYYYRPKKNIVIRPNSLGGQGFHITGDHRQTIPNLFRYIETELGNEPLMNPKENETHYIDAEGHNFVIQSDLNPISQAIINLLIQKHPSLKTCVISIILAFNTLTKSFSGGGTLFLCGNGGSFSDAMHIAAELNKSFSLPRPISPELKSQLVQYPYGNDLAKHLQKGLRAITLGVNPSLVSAIENDFSFAHLHFAQELSVHGKPGDVLLGISTSGQSKNVLHAASVAKARGMKVIILTGPKSSPLQSLADVAIMAPGGRTADIQESHVQIYHTLCEILEHHFFGENP